MPPSDGADNEVCGSFNLVEGMGRQIEPAGHFYAKLQGKVFRAAQRKLAADSPGSKTEVDESSEDEEEELKGSEEKAKEADYGKKRKAKTKEEIQR